MTSMNVMSTSVDRVFDELPFIGTSTPPHGDFFGELALIFTSTPVASTDGGPSRASGLVGSGSAPNAVVAMLKSAATNAVRARITSY